MKHTIIIFTSILFALTACGSPTNEPVPTKPSSYIPSPADSNLTREQIFLDSSDLLTMESFPLQFLLKLKGNLPTPCHQLRISVNPPDSQNTINIDIYSVVDPNTICAQVLEPFDVNYPLGSFPTGHYILLVNGIQIAEFDG